MEFVKNSRMHALLSGEQQNNRQISDSTPTLMESKDTMLLTHTATGSLKIQMRTNIKLLFFTLLH